MSTVKNKPRKKNVKDKALPLPHVWERIDHFFQVCNIETARKDMWMMLKLSLLSEQDGISARDRGNMVCLYENSLELFANIFRLLEQRKKIETEL